MNRCSRKINVRIRILSVRLYSHDHIYHRRAKELYNKTHPSMCIIHNEFWSTDSQWKWCKHNTAFNIFFFSVNVSIRWVIVNSKIMISSNLNVSRRSPFNWGHLNVIHHHWPYQTRKRRSSFFLYNKSVLRYFSHLLFFLKKIFWLSEWRIRNNIAKPMKITPMIDWTPRLLTTNRKENPNKDMNI